MADPIVPLLRRTNGDYPSNSDVHSSENETYGHSHGVVNYANTTAISTANTTVNTNENETKIRDENGDSLNAGDIVFECNICLEQVIEPVVTLCGHLYCWKCLYRWLNNNNICPVCKAGVTKENVVPIYSRGAGKVDPRERPVEVGIPNRPPGQRPIPETRHPNTGFAPFAGQTTQHDFTFSPAFGFFPSLFGLQFQVVSNSPPTGGKFIFVYAILFFGLTPILAAATAEEAQQAQLSKMLFMLGTLVIVCLLVF